MSMTVTATPTFTWYTKKVSANIRSAVRQGTEDTAQAIKARAVQYTPRATGAAQQSWTVEYAGSRSGAVSQGGASYVYRVISLPELGTAREGGAFYVGWLENGYTDRAGKWVPGHFMLQRATNELANLLVLNVTRYWNSWVA